MKNINRIGIYHSKDLDGICSGAILKLKFPDIVLIGFDYGENIWDKLQNAGFDIKPGSVSTFIEGYHPEVYMVDVSLPMPEMKRLAEWCGHKLTWIDHHQSAIQDFWNTFDPLANVPDRIPNINYYTMSINNFGRVVFKVGRAACELCWQYCFGASVKSYNNGRPLEPIPEIVQYLGEYDTWRNEDKERWDRFIMPFQYGMRLICKDINEFPMQLLEQSEVFDPLIGPDPIRAKCDSIIRDGYTVLRYQKQMNDRAAKMISFETEFEGYKAICMNSGGANSQLFESVYDPAKHDIMIPFVFTGKHWTFSIYTTKPDIDCSVIAKKYGGGGHKQAAGFTCGSSEDYNDIPKAFIDAMHLRNYNDCL